MGDRMTTALAAKTCSIPDCKRARKTRGLCGTHYQYHYKHGTLPDTNPGPGGRPTGTGRAFTNGLTVDSDWIAKGNCYLMDDPRIMFRPSGVYICERCPVTADCSAYRRRLEDAAGVPVPGVWGGVFWVGATNKRRAHESKVGA